MPTPVILQGTSYNLATQSDSPPWGSDQNALIQALVTIANSTTGSSDILTTSFNLTNNQIAAANIVGLSFDTSQVRSAVIPYSIYISTATNEFSECGTIYITYKSTANTWELAQNYVGSSGLVFTVTPSGQVQYTSTNVSGASYVGKLKFKASAFLQT